MLKAVLDRLLRREIPIKDEKWEPKGKMAKSHETLRQKDRRKQVFWRDFYSASRLITG